MTCALCRKPGGTVNAGGDLGLVHRACFTAWDRAQEANEHGGWVLMSPDPSGETTRPHHWPAASRLRQPNRGAVEKARARLRAKGIRVAA